MHAHSYAQESQKSTSGILPYYSLHYYLRQILPVHLEFTDLLGWLASQLVPRIPLSPSPSARIMCVLPYLAFHVLSRNLMLAQ